MDRFVFRRVRQSGVALPSSSARPQSVRVETCVTKREGQAETSQSQSQSQTQPASQATLSQAQCQAQRGGGGGDVFHLQTQIHTPGHLRNKAPHSQSENLSEAELVLELSESDCEGGGAGVDQPAAEPEHIQKRVQPSKVKGSSRGVRTFQAHWTVTFPWLEYQRPKDAVFCRICKSAFEKNCVTFTSQLHMSFIDLGFRNWRKALERFRRHERSDCHREAVLKTTALNSGVTVSSAMSKSQTANRVENREALLKILSSLMYLVTQGLAIRGHVDDTSNFVNLLRLRCQDSPTLSRWMHRTSYKWCSHEMTNEMLEIMSHHVTRSLVSRLKEAKYYALMVDETADNSIQEQLSFCFRMVTEKLEVEEFFLGFHSATNTRAETIFQILLDVLCRFNLPVRDCRGQCFDGARNMAGSIQGVQARMRAEEPRALFVHCMAHSLSLTVHDLVKQIPGCRNVLNLAQEMITFIRESPKRHHIFQTFQGVDGDTAPKTLRPFCPTRWTVRFHSLSSILCNFKELMEVMEELSESDKSDAGFKAHGFYRVMSTFDFFFHLSLLCKVLSYVDATNSALQRKRLHFQEAAAMISMLRAVLSDFRGEFDSFWGEVTAKADSLALAQPKIPRKRQLPSRFRDGEDADVPPWRTPEKLYSHTFSNVLDTICECISSRFQSEAMSLMENVERFLTRAVKKLAPKVQQHFKGDVNLRQLKVERGMLLQFAKTKQETIESIADAVSFLKRHTGCREMLPQMQLFLRLVLTIPVSTSTAERSFSTLKRLKNYLRTTVTQKRLKHLALLDVHTDLAKEADLEAIISSEEDHLQD